MIKRVMINWLLPVIIDLAIQAIQSLAIRSDNDIDDKIVNEVAKNKDKLIEEIKTNL